MTITLPTRLKLSQTPTPFYHLERLSAELAGPRIWIKRDDVTEAAVSGNKIRKLEFVLARAMMSGCDVIVTSGGLQSNHCRATALLCARLGLTAHLLLRDEGDCREQPDGNLLLDYLAGAAVTIAPRADYLRNQAALIDAIVKNYEAQGRSVWVIPVGASDGHGVWGYVNCAAELKNDFARVGIAPQKLFHATGSGGTQAGLSAGAVIHHLPCQVIGMAVCDSEDYFVSKVRQDLRHWATEYAVGLAIEDIPVTVNDHYIGPGYAIASEEVFRTIRRVGALEGLVLDPVYTGKAFFGMVSEIENGALKDCADVVFVHTGGIFGLMAQADNLGFHRSARAD